VCLSEEATGTGKAVLQVGVLRVGWVGQVNKRLEGCGGPGEVARPRPDLVSRDQGGSTKFVCPDHDGRLGGAGEHLVGQLDRHVEVAGVAGGLEEAETCT
jgi:hypothetical protein